MAADGADHEGNKKTNDARFTSSLGNLLRNMANAGITKFICIILTWCFYLEVIYSENWFNYALMVLNPRSSVFGLRYLL